MGLSQPLVGAAVVLGIGTRWCWWIQSLYWLPAPCLWAPVSTVWQVGCTFGVSSSFEPYLSTVCSGFQIALGDICLSPAKAKGQRGGLPCTEQTGNCSLNFVLFLEGSRCPASLSHKRTLINVGVLADELAQWAACPSDVLAFCYWNRASRGSITHQEFSAAPSTPTASNLGAQLKTWRLLRSQDTHFTLEIRLSTESTQAVWM